MSDAQQLQCTSSRCSRFGSPAEVPWVCRCGARFCSEACWIQAWHAGHQRHCPHAGAIVEEAAVATSRRRGAALLASIALKRRITTEHGDEPALCVPVREQPEEVDEVAVAKEPEESAPEAVPPAPKLTLHDFDYVCELGSGACGSVSKVLKRGTQEVFALKAIEKSRVQKHNLQEHVKREVEVQRSLDHENIIRLYDSFEDSNRIYLLLEYSPGGHLFSKIQKCGKLPERDAAIILSDVIRALLVLHGKGIVHRDLKPENVLLFDGGHAKIADFGWCGELQPSGRMTFCGTMDYLSPEMIVHQGHDHRVDTWAVGVLLYEMLVGHPPFSAKSGGDSIQRILKVDLCFPSDLGEAACDLIQRLIQFEPCRRMALQETLAHPWLLEATRRPAGQDSVTLAGSTSPRFLPKLLPLVSTCDVDTPTKGAAPAEFLMPDTKPAIPKIGGFSTLEGLGSKPPRPRSQAQRGPSKEGSSFFGDALQPCTREWSSQVPPGLAAGRASRRPGRDFMLGSCLMPLGEGSAGEWKPPSRQASPSAWPGGRPGFGGDQQASMDKSPRTWRDTNTYSAVRSWVRGEVTRQVLARELDKTIRPGDEKASSTSTGTPASLSSSTSSFVSEGEFSAAAGVDRHGQLAAPLPVLLAKPSNINAGSSGYGPKGWPVA